MLEEKKNDFTTMGSQKERALTQVEKALAQKRKAQNALTELSDADKRDPLTGLLSKKEFRYAMKQYASANSFMTAFMIDSFEEYVEKQGHVVANETIKMIGELIQKKAAELEDAFFFRIGQAKFGGIILNPTLEAVMELAQKICQLTETQTGATLACGIAPFELIPDDERDNNKLRRGILKSMKSGSGPERLKTRRMLRMQSLRPDHMQY